MNLQDAKALAELLLEEYGLDQQGWTFDWHSLKKVAGRCNYVARLITLSHSYASHNDERLVENTLRHEVAHALVGPGQHHNQVWKRKALEVGCTAERCVSSETVYPMAKYTLSCSTCGKTYQFHRRPAGAKGCGVCSPRRFDPRFVLTVTQNW